MHFINAQLLPVSLGCGCRRGQVWQMSTYADIERTGNRPLPTLESQHPIRRPMRKRQKNKRKEVWFVLERVWGERRLW
jgi:hypothetical protein